MNESGAVYLVSGDDGAKIDSWRSRLRRRAEEDGGPGALEAFDGRSSSPEDVAAALATLSFFTGTRYVLADGVEVWKAGALEPLERELGAVPAETVLVLIARGKPPARLAKAVEEAGGECRSYAAPKPWELPKWVVEHARERGLGLDVEGARALVAAVGARQQRLAQEVEKLALCVHPRTEVSAEEVERLTVGDASRQAYDLADALVAADAAGSLAIGEELAVAGERPARLVYPIVRRLRDVHRAAELIELGVPEQQVSAALKMPPWAAKRTVQKARKADRRTLERAICLFADLEVELRGGGGDLDEDTAFSRTLAAASTAV